MDISKGTIEFVLPPDCHDTRSCAEHKRCMYIGCVHSEWDPPMVMNPAYAVKAKLSWLSKSAPASVEVSGFRFPNLKDSD